MKKSLFIFLITTILLSSCQKVVDANKLLDTEEQVSIIGYISPSDEILRVFVSKALPAIGTPIKINQEGPFPSEFLITDALVSITNIDGEYVLFTYNAETNSYIADATQFPIEENKEYFLKVKVGKKEYNASCNIPKKVKDITGSKKTKIDSFGSEVTTVNLSFSDFAEETNFYIVGGSYHTTFLYEGEEPYTNTEFLYFDSSEFLTDKLRDGGVLKGVGETYNYNSSSLSHSSFTLQVANVEEILFQHLRTTSTNDDTEGNPFAEYAIAPTNFLDEGAIGIFAGYSITEKVITIEE